MLLCQRENKNSCDDCTTRVIILDERVLSTVNASRNHVKLACFQKIFRKVNYQRGNHTIIIYTPNLRYYSCQFKLLVCCFVAQQLINNMKKSTCVFVVPKFKM